MSEPARALSAPPSPSTARSQLEALADTLGKALLDKPRVVRDAVSCLIARGHVLLEDVPGVGKTTLAEALGKACGLAYARVQFTADLMPADIVGAQVFESRTSEFRFRPGPVFQQLVLADELNRAPPRTQSALLEAMSQGQVSVDGVSHALPEPFFVVATQNPLELSGTYPLPDSQLDRFMMRLTVGHPSAAAEARLIQTRKLAGPLDEVRQVIDPTGLVALQSTATEVALGDDVARYAIELATATRTHPEIERGVSTRGTLSLTAAARAQALWEGRPFVSPGDVRAVAVPTLAHRIVLRSQLTGSAGRSEAAGLLEEILAAVPSPR